MGEHYHTPKNNEKLNSQLEQFAKLLPPSGEILDAGSGVGRPPSEFLAKQGFNVRGVYISKRMVDLAKENVPEAMFYKKNILNLDFPDKSFDDIICVYTL